MRVAISGAVDFESLLCLRGTAAEVLVVAMALLESGTNVGASGCSAVSVCSVVRWPPKRRSPTAREARPARPLPRDGLEDAFRSGTSRDAEVEDDAGAIEAGRMAKSASRAGVALAPRLPETTGSSLSRCLARRLPLRRSRTWLPFRSC